MCCHRPEGPNVNARRGLLFLVAMLPVSVSAPCLHRRAARPQMTLARAEAGRRELNHSSKLKPLGGQIFYRTMAHERRPQTEVTQAPPTKTHTLRFCCWLHIRSAAPGIPNLLLIYCTAVILSQLTFKGRGKSAISGVKEGFIIRGDPPLFEGPSSACGKVFDPDYWFPAPVRAGGEGSTALSKKEH